MPPPTKLELTLVTLKGGRAGEADAIEGSERSTCSGSGIASQGECPTVICPIEPLPLGFRASLRVGALAPCYPVSMDDFYGQDLACVHAEAFEALAAAAAQTLLRFLGQAAPSRRVLDLGCGAGPVSRRLSEQGFST